MQGLMTPILKNADQKSLAAISAEVISAAFISINI
jgi:pyruvate/2-oxoglutarate dehydrogenase complex dihydrolipoamide acyltransferase (E2) component